MQRPVVFPGCGCSWIRGKLHVACRSAQVSSLVSAASECVFLAERRAFGVGRVLLFDIQGWITLLLGGLLALITLFSSYSRSPIGGLALAEQLRSGSCEGL